MEITIKEWVFEAWSLFIFVAGLVAGYVFKMVI